MPRYLFQGSYSREGAQGLLLDGFHYAFGETELYIIVELPGNVAAGAASLIVAASGAGHWRTTVLLSAEEMDQATRTGGGYRAPGA